MRVYIICPVRKASTEELEMLREYMNKLKEQGHEVFLPNDHAPQEDPTGEKIVKLELEEIKKADEVHIFWHSESYGSHFDLGAAMALNKNIKLIHEFNKDIEGKSYSKVIKLYEKQNNKRYDYVWLLYNTTISSDGKLDERYLFSVYRNLDEALKGKKQAKEWQKKYAPDRKGRRVFIKRKVLSE